MLGLVGLVRFLFGCSVVWFVLVGQLIGHLVNWLVHWPVGNFDRVVGWYFGLCLGW